MRILWTGIFAIVMTALVFGVWAALLLTNLARQRFSLVGHRHGRRVVGALV